MPCNCYQKLLGYLHFVEKDSTNAQDKLAKIRPLITMVREEFVKREPEYNSVDKQIIPTKTKCLSIRQLNPKKQKKWLFKNLFCAGISGFMCDFFVYGKDSAELDDGKFGQLQKCVQVVVKLYDDLPGHKNYKVFFDNWFTILDLLHHFRLKGMHIAGTIRLNHLQGFPLDAKKISRKMAEALWIIVAIAILE